MINTDYLTLHHHPDPSKTILLEIVQDGDSYKGIIHVQESFGWVSASCRHHGDTPEEAKEIALTAVKKVRQMGLTAVVKGDSKPGIRDLLQSKLRHCWGRLDDIQQRIPYGPVDFIEAVLWLIPIIALLLVFHGPVKFAKLADWKKLWS
jgi:hypothetical protein